MGQAKSKGMETTVTGSKELAQAELPKAQDSRWQLGGKLSQIYIYPVKSTRGISVPKASIEKHGLKYGPVMDRQFMIVDSNGKFITGRQFPKLVTIQASFNGTILSLAAPNMPPIEASISEDSDLIDTEVFGMKCQCLDLGPEIGAWIGRHLGKEHLGFKVIYHDYSKRDSSRQIQDLNMDLRPLTKETDVPLYADGYGFFLCTEASIDVLNDKLTNLQVTHKTFRPNLVVKGDFELKYVII